MLERLELYVRLMRLDKPIGSLLLLWPTLWAVWLAAQGRPAWTVVVIFTLGTVLMRSAGCVVNDLADRHYDPYVERTKNRPLASGKVSVTEALILFFILVSSAFCLVLFFQSWYVIALSVCALFLAASYPFTKRFFAVPQAYLGVAFGFGIPMAFAVQLETIPAVGWLMLLANIFWAVAYDTEYAMVDRPDDLKIGIKTSAITFGQYDVLAVMLCYALMLLLMLWVGMRLAMHWPYFCALGVAAMIACYHYLLIKDREPGPCFKAFLHNNWVGAVLFVGVLAESYIQ